MRNEKWGKEANRKDKGWGSQSILCHLSNDKIAFIVNPLWISIRIEFCFIFNSFLFSLLRFSYFNQISLDAGPDDDIRSDAICYSGNSKLIETQVHEIQIEFKSKHWFNECCVFFDKSDVFSASVFTVHLSLSPSCRLFVFMIDRHSTEFLFYIPKNVNQ